MWVMVKGYLVRRPRGAGLVLANDGGTIRDEVRVACLEQLGDSLGGSGKGCVVRSEEGSSSFQSSLMTWGQGG